MASLGLAGRLAGTPVRRLSAGQRRRTALAALVARRPELWLLDEPHAGLDADGRDLLDGLRAPGRRRRRHRGGRLPRARPGRAARPPRGARWPAGSSSRCAPRSRAVDRRRSRGAEGGRPRGRQGPADRGPQPRRHQPGAPVRARACCCCSPSPSTPTGARSRAATPGLFWVAVLFVAGARRPAVLRRRDGRRRAATPCACPASTRPASSSARPARSAAAAARARGAARRRGRGALRRRPARPRAPPCSAVTVAGDDRRPGRHRYALRCPRRRRRGARDAAPAAPAPGGGAGPDRRHEGLRSGARHRAARPRRRAGPGSACSGCSPLAYSAVGLAGLRAAPGGRMTPGSPATGTRGHAGHRRRWPSVGLGWLLLFGLVLSPADVGAGRGGADHLRPRAVGVAGLPRLRRHRPRLGAATSSPSTRSLAWDRVAGASAEIGVLFTGPHARAPASIWGRLTWGVLWTLGRPPHLHRAAVPAVPRLPRGAPAPGPPGRAGQARAPSPGSWPSSTCPIVHLSVEWWRTLHQERHDPAARSATPRSTGSMLFTLFVGVVAFTLVYVLADDPPDPASLDDGGRARGPRPRAGHRGAPGRGRAVSECRGAPMTPSGAGSTVGYAGVVFGSAHPAAYAWRHHGLTPCIGAGAAGPAAARRGQAVGVTTESCVHGTELTGAGPDLRPRPARPPPPARSGAAAGLGRRPSSWPWSSSASGVILFQGLSNATRLLLQRRRGRRSAATARAASASGSRAPSTRARSTARTPAPRLHRHLQRRHHPGHYQGEPGGIFQEGMPVVVEGRMSGRRHLRRRPRPGEAHRAVHEAKNPGPGPAPDAP